MKNRIIRTFVFTLIILVICQSLMAEIKIVKLKYAKPDSVILTLNQLFGKKIKIAAAPMINAVVINSDNRELLCSIDRLIQGLDRRPALLRFSVKRDFEQNFKQHKTRVGPKNLFNQIRSQSHETGQNSVIALEYCKARLTNDNIRIFTYSSIFGEAIEPIIITRGLMISGHLIDNNIAQIEIWYSTGEGFDSETLLTTLEVPLGQWISFGGASNASNQASPEIKMGKNFEISAQKSGRYIDRRYLIKVDLVKY